MNRNEPNNNDQAEFDYEGLADELDQYAEQTPDRTDPGAVREPVSIEEWLSYEYIGSAAEVLYPFWEERLIEFFEGDYNEWIIDGGLGSGKTFAAMLATLYKLYELSCYEHPQRLYSFADQSTIALTYLSLKQSTASKTGFDELRGFVKDAPYFQETFPPESSTKSELQFKRNIRALSGSTGSTLKGLNVLVCVLDEANFWKQGGGTPGNIEKVRRIYEDATARRRTRFVEDGVDPGFSIVISSATHAQSFIEQRKQKSTGHCLHTRARKYQVKPGDFSEDHFLMFRGTDAERPRIVETPDEFRALVEDLDEQVEVPEERLERIVNEGDPHRLEGPSVSELLDELPASVSEAFVVLPVNFKDDFQTNPYEALKNIAGVPVGASNTLFSHPEHWNNCEQEGEFPFTQKEITLSTESDRTLDDYYKPDVLGDPVNPEAEDPWQYRPSRHPNAPRFVHVDLSSTEDPTGLAMCHVAGVRRDEEDERVGKVIEVDWMVRIVPPAPPGQLPHSKVRRFIGRLKSNYHFPIRTVGVDQHAGMEFRQQLEDTVLTKDGENVVNNSTDRDDGMWKDFRTLLYQERVQFRAYEPFRREFFNLVHDREAHKVDHPKKFPNGDTAHDDVSCAVVGAAHLALQSDAEPTGGRFIEDRPDTRGEAMRKNQKGWVGSHGVRPFQSREERRSEKFTKDLIDLQNYRD